MTDLSPSSVRALVERLRKMQASLDADELWDMPKTLLGDTATALLALLERVEAAEADAARYRFLRKDRIVQALFVRRDPNNSDYLLEADMPENRSSTWLDDRIDAARGAER